MSNPLFRVGEKVGLVSKSFPERNGEYTVRQVIGKGDSYTCRLTGNTFIRSTNGLAYSLEENPEMGSFEHEAIWNESALRKIHPKANKSFEQLLSELKVGKIDTIEA